MANPRAGCRRILMTTDTLGGVWDYAIELARGLARSGTTTVLAALGPPLAPERRAAAAAVPGLDLLEGAYRLEWMDDPEEDLRRSADWLLALEHRHGPDLVHINGYAQAALPWRAPVVAVGHSCVLSWWRAVHGVPAPTAWDGYAARVAAGLKAAARVVAPTRVLLDTLARLYGPLPHGRVVFNGRDAAQWRPSRKEKFVLTAGRLWDAGKNGAALDAVAPRLDWPVMAAGDWRRPEGGGEPFRHLRSLGPLEPAALADWYGRATIYALPARYEPFGLSVLEAALSGCALVLGDIPSLRELWHGAAAFVPPDDHDALATVLRGLIADPVRRRRAALAARRRAFGYSADAMTDGYRRLYADVVAP